ncbi:MAG: hypothetical protein OXD01_09590 [Gammaproteobacteria bacterium]|nr:hypothetical protein [Gammaproteobacteria bacterium]
MFRCSQKVNIIPVGSVPEICIFGLDGDHLFAGELVANKGG